MFAMQFSGCMCDICQLLGSHLDPNTSNFTYSFVKLNCNQLHKQNRLTAHLDSKSSSPKFI